MTMEQEHIIAVEQLQVGIYVHLDLGWMSHPFSFNSFKIRSQDQIQTIRDTGLKTVRWNPERSDLRPLPVPAPGASPAAATTTTAPGTAATAETGATPVADPAIMSAKQARIQRLAEHRQRIARVEKEFLNAARTVRSLEKTIFSMPDQALATASELVGQMVGTLLAAPDLAIHVMGDHSSVDEAYSHALNVSVLAMILARELNFPAEVVQVLGLGTLFHDVGLSQVPSKIVNKTEPLTKSEREFVEMHCQYGVEICKKAGLPAAALRIVQQHHELYDGSGYPGKLKGEAIDPLARVAALANAFDSLCNPPQAAQALTPHEALSQMFAQHRSRFDPKLLQLFIRFMGVYPAGTVVGLSNEMLGMVIAVNAGHPLKPTVVVYDPEVPRHEAIVLDLIEDEDVNICRAIRPQQLLPAVFDYLSPRRRVSYYFDAGHKPAGNGA